MSRRGLVSEPYPLPIRSKAQSLISDLVIEANLRLPSMLPGKKAFDRLQWAFKNVIDASLAWLFYDLRSPLTVNGEVQGALAAHAPTIKVLEPSPEPLQQVLCPSFALSKDAGDDDTREEAAELLEWLSLTMSRSPRVQKGDSVDPFLCRYCPAEDVTPLDLVSYQWRGFAPAAFVLKILLAAMKASSSSNTTAGDAWFALSGASFDGKGYTILKHGSEVMTWNYAD
jgi:ribonuclease P/MRP protein subunit RPP40